MGYRALEDSEVARFDKRQLHEFLLNHKKVELAADRLQIADLWAKLQGDDRVRNGEFISTYKDLVKAAVKSGKVTPEARELCHVFQNRNPVLIGYACHSSALAKVGWAPEEFQQGARNK